MGAAAPAKPSTTVMGRKVADPDAVHQRRMSRKMRRQRRDDLNAEQAVGIIKQRMRDVVRRMVRLYRLTDYPADSLIHFFDYWSLRRLGLDALSTAARHTGKFDGTGPDRQAVLCDPSDSPAWRWWISLQWMKRLELSGAGVYILHGIRMPHEVDEYAARITNPAFEIEETPIDDDTLLSRLPVGNS